LLNRQGSYSGLQKISVACRTCDVSDSFYSSTSITRFRLEHVGHEVVEGRPTAWPRTEPPNGRQDAEKVRLLKVMVELVMLPAYPSPVFTITGVREDLKSAFVQVVSPSQRDQVKETLEKGKYLDSGSSDTVYVWEPKAISFSEDANMAMNFDASLSAVSNPEPNPAAEEPLRSEAPSASRDAREIHFAEPAGEQSALTISEVAPQAESPILLVPPDPSDSAAPPPSSGSLPEPETPTPTTEQAGEAEAPISEPPEPEAVARPSPESGEVPVPVRSEAKEAAAVSSSEGSQESKADEDNYLLVSRSWYIEGGPKNMSEAVRISRLLRPFRWTVEPAYTIGVMVDDILSVETANGEIGGDMTKQIEAAGYKLARVSVQKGKPVAWFKREQASG
jgi:hypothetical protein